MELLHDLPDHVEKALRQEQAEDQRLLEAAAARLLIASFEACYKEAKTLEALVKQVKPIAGWLRKTIAWRQQQVETLLRARKEQDGSFDPQAPSAGDILEERLIMKVSSKQTTVLLSAPNGFK